MANARVGQIPAASVNENPTPEQKRPTTPPATPGPVRGEKGEYKRASYKTQRGNTRTDR